MKTCYVHDRTGTLRPITKRAYYVKELNQDLLGGSALTAADYSVILDKNDDIAGIYPVRDDGTIGAGNSFPFVGEYPGNMTFGIEDWDTAQTNVFARQFLIQSD